MPRLQAPVALIGLPGSGKTTLGRRLAERLQVPWLDSDSEIERSSGHPPGYWLQTQGEPAFRRIEQAWLQAWQPDEACILSTGGGLPCYQDNLEQLGQKALTVYLELDDASIFQRLQAPPHPLTRLYDAAGLSALFARRRLIYRQASLTLAASGSCDELVSRLLAELTARDWLQ